MSNTSSAAPQLTAIPEIAVTSAFDRDACTVNVRRNMMLGFPRLHQLPEFGKPKGLPIAIVGGGPSLRERIRELTGFRIVMVCASAHDYVVEHGIYPRYAVVLDPGAQGTIGYFNFRLDTCTYLVSSHVEPALLAHFDGYAVALWHCMGEAGPKAFRGEPQIMGGCTATLRATFIALAMGYTDQHYFGLDSCYGANGSHAYTVHETMPEAREITVEGGRTFQTTVPWVAQAQQFFKAIEMTRGAFHATLHGDGLIAEMTRQGNPAFNAFVSLA